MRTIKLVKSFLGTLAACAVLGMCAHAQTVIPASNPDNALTSGAGLRVQTVNCDMIYDASGGQIKAIAYGDVPSTTGYLYVEDYASNSLTISIPGAANIDIALANNLTNNSDFIIAAIWIDGADVYLETFDVTNVGTSSLSVSSSGTNYLGTSELNYRPHIDMYSDPSNPVGGYASLHQFAATWNDGGASNSQINMVYGEVSPSVTISTPVILSGFGAIHSDVACSYDISTSEAHAYVTYQDNASNIDVVDYNITTTASSVNSSINGGNSGEQLRIEALNLYDPAFGWPPYTVVYTEFSDINIYDINNGVTTINTGMPNYPGHMWIPAIGVGPGLLAGSKYANDNYTVGWFDETANHFYTNGVSTSTGGLNYPDYYEVNRTAWSSTFYYDFPEILAISSSSNYGEDELLTAWENNGDIYYKYQGDITQYKPTNVNEIKTASYKLYPNPATDRMLVEGITEAAYHITDMAGRTLQSGSLTQKNSIVDINGLSAGMYLISLSENGSTRQMKFTKQ